MSSDDRNAIPAELRGTLVDLLAQLDSNVSSLSRGAGYVDQDLAKIADIRDAIARVLGYPPLARPLATSRPVEPPRETALAELRIALDGLRVACAAALPAFNRARAESVAEPWAAQFGELERTLRRFALSELG